MKYTSTRNASIRSTFEEAVCSGYSPDGGLFVPTSLPKITPETLQEWSKLSYPDLSFQVLRRFIAPEEVPDDALKEICTSAFEGFVDPAQAVPVVKVGSMYIAELFHGPTFCFKDLGMRAVVNLLSYFSKKRQRKITLVVSTTGDTGPAAVRAVSDINNPLLTILVHFPEGQISDFQRKQLTTVDSPCVKVAAFQGGGDDMDKPIKTILAGQDRQGNTLMTGVNSYNIGRPLMQAVHYFWTYLRVVQDLKVTPGDPNTLVDIVLPTGAMGNIAGGYMSKKMGVPLGKLNAGVNVNDITHRVMQTGEFHKSPAMLKTLSEAINVQVPYNFERLLFYLTDGNHTLVHDWMTTVDATSKLDLNRDWLQRLQQDFDSARVTDEEMCETICSIQQKYKYLADPHTAVALCAAKKLGYSLDQEQKIPAALLATASPCKFKESVSAAIQEQGWADYVATSFPDEAKVVLEKPENPVIVYKAKEGCSLNETQMEWEATVRQTVASFGTSN